MARVLTAEQQAEAFRMLGDPKKFNVDVVSAMFAYHKNGGIKFYSSDIITIGPTESRFVKAGTKTNLGIYITNKYLIEDLEVFGYINKPFTGKVLGNIDSSLSKALQEGDVTREQWGTYIDRSQWFFGGPMAFIMNVSLSETVMQLPPKAKKLRKELLEEKKDDIAAGDPQASMHVEREVVSAALAEMRKTGDPSMALFDSGCGIDPYNQYKTIFVMKGAVQDNTGESSTGYKIVTSNYDEGVSKDDMAKIADSVVTSAYSSGVATQDSGTNGKKYNALFQRVRLQPRGTDCGTKDTIDVLITPDNADGYIYRNIVDGSKIRMLTPDNIKTYHGKTVKMRTGIHCKAPDPEYCACCIGDRPYRIGIRNIGFAFMSISGSTLNASLKKKHDVSIKTYNVTLSDVLKYVK